MVRSCESDVRMHGVARNGTVRLRPNASACASQLGRAGDRVALCVALRAD
jgi:hypothetical protein